VYITYFGVYPQHYGWLFVVNIVGLMAVSMVNRRLVHRYPLEALLKNAVFVTTITAIVLAQSRIACKISQAEAAVRANLSRNTIGHIENGDTGVAIGKILRYIDVIRSRRSIISETNKAPGMVFIPRFMNNFLHLTSFISGYRCYDRHNYLISRKLRIEEYEFIYYYRYSIF